MEFTSEQVAEMVGIPYRTLMGWVERGLIRPHSYQARRRVPVLFSDKDLKEVKLMKCLRQQLSGQALRRAINYLRGIKHNPLSSGKFLAVGRGKKDLIKICNQKEAISLIREEGQLLFLDHLDLRKAFTKEVL